MIIQKKTLKQLRSKIYNKQKNLLEHMHEYNIDTFIDTRIKTHVGEIKILEEIFDIKLEEYQNQQELFWSGFN